MAIGRWMKQLGLFILQFKYPQDTRIFINIHRNIQVELTLTKI